VIVSSTADLDNPESPSLGLLQQAHKEIYEYLEVDEIINKSLENIEVFT
jgi:hypothetical protein